MHDYAVLHKHICFKMLMQAKSDISLNNYIFNIRVVIMPFSLSFKLNGKRVTKCIAMV